MCRHVEPERKAEKRIIVQFGSEPVNDKCEEKPDAQCDESQIARALPVHRGTALLFRHELLPLGETQIPPPQSIIDDSIIVVMLINVFGSFNYKSVESSPMLKHASTYFGTMVASFRFWAKPTPIDDFASLADFCFAQSAHIAQTTLYGYLRTRAGLQHFNLFTDETFVEMLRPARSRLVLVCVDDLVLYCIAVVGARAGLSPAQMQRLGVSIMDAVIARLAQADLPDGELEGYARDFAARIKLVDWSARARPEHAFELPPQALIDLAPIIDTLKELDHEIVVNSMRFKWRGVRAAFVQRLDADTLVARAGLNMAKESGAENSLAEKTRALT